MTARMAPAGRPNRMTPRLTSIQSARRNVSTLACVSAGMHRIRW